MSTELFVAATSARIRPLRREDIEFVADLHARCLPHGLFPALGRRFLRRYLLTYVETPFAVAMLAESAAGPIGYLVGVFAPKEHRRQVLRRHGRALACLGIASLARRPRVAVRFLRTRARRYVASLMRSVLWRDLPPAGRPSLATAPAVLSHVAVAPDGRRSGVGVALVHAFEETARDFGASEAILLTLDGVGGAGPFYGRLGWQPVGSGDDRDGMSWTRYQKDL